MTPTEAAEALVARTGHGRYREWVGDPEREPRLIEAAARLGPGPYAAAAVRPREFAGHGHGHGPAGGRVRCCIIGPSLFVGGAEAWAAALLRYTDPALFEWAGVGVTEGPHAANPAMAAAVSRLAPLAYGPAACRALAAGCAAAVTWAVPDVPGLLRDAAVRPKVVAVSHSTADSAYARRLFGGLAGVDRFVAVSEGALGPLTAAQRAGAAVVWNCVDADRVTPRRPRDAVRAAWGVPPGAKVAGYLGRLSEEKDPTATARLAAHLPPPWHVVAVGEGPEWAELVGARADGRLDRLHLPGADPDAGSVLAAFDVLIVPSRYESFGLTIAEGLWCGLPVVSTAVGLAAMAPGLTREVMIDAPGPALAAAVLADAADPAGTAARVERGRAFARARLSPERFGREWGALIRRLVKPRVPLGTRQRRG